MNDAELHRQLTAANPWWRSATGWELDDPDLRRLRDTSLEYEPDPLHDIVPDGLYVLRGPRRVGKSVEIKRTISRLIARGVSARRVIHFACDGLTAGDLRRLQRVGRDQATRQLVEPRYWFLDEITAVDGWPEAIKWLRDNTGLGQDCVVLTGSSARDLEEARKALAGRRGAAVDSDRLLLPMSFRAFCIAQGFTGLPSPDPIRPRDFLGSDAENAVYELLPWLDDLVSLWEIYCRVGGFPKAVTASFDQAAPGSGFVDALWDVIHGDALASASASPVQSLHLLLKLSKNLASPVNMSAVAEEIGVSSHHTAKARVKALVDAYLAWPCYQRGDHQMPNLNAQEKIYFTDPLLARIAHLRADHLPAPDTSKISEQQIGLALVRHVADGDPGRYADFTSVMYTRSTTGQEVDFCGRPLAAVAFEGKYVDDKLVRESQTMRSMFSGGVLATRSKLDDVQGARAIPAAFIAYLLTR
jgi:hypothetical protein